MRRFLSIINIALIAIFLSGCEKGYEPTPLIKNGEFPFVLEYELEGQRYIIEDTVVCSFDGHDLSNPFPIVDYARSWEASLKSGDESKRLLIEFAPNTESVFVKGRINTESRVILFYGSGGYYLGDPEHEDRYPYINYVEQYEESENASRVEFKELSVQELEDYFGIKLIRFEFSKPIKNTFEEYKG